MKVLKKKIIKKEGTKKEENGIRLTFYVSREAEEKVRTAAKKDGRSMSNFMDRHIKENL